MTRVVVLAGGSPHAHDFAAIGDALGDLLAGHGIEVERFDHPDRAAARLDEGDVDALVVDGLWWQMLADVYEPWRSHAYSTPVQTRTSLAGFVADGGGLVALHTTPICFDDWPEWGDVVGGSWQWGVSSHPPLGPVMATIVAVHSVTAGLPDVVTLTDEVYGDMAVRDEVEILATARRTPDDADQPVLWTHRYGHGRVVFDGFGHDPESIENEDHARLIVQAVDWVTSGVGSAAHASTNRVIGEQR